MERKLKQQLDRCRVPHDTEPFEFLNYGRGYWIVKGPVPLEVALEIYADPASNHIRVDGHCGCPRPEYPWVTWRMSDGTELLTLDDKAQLETVSHLSPDFYEGYMKRFTFSDDPEVRARAKCYVELYHIDSEVGLRVFVDYLRWHKLI